MNKFEREREIENIKSIEDACWLTLWNCLQYQK